MALEDSTKSISTSKEELDVISNRIAIALAKREKLIKSWTALSARPKEPEKTQEELDAEDAALFRKQPPYLGVGAPIPSHFLVSDAERNNKSLRAKFFPAKGLKGSKSRDEEEKAASAKRGLIDESSDEEGGRSSVGKAKKRKTTADLPSKETKSEDKPITKDKVAKEKQSDSFAAPPSTPTRQNANNRAERSLSTEAKGPKVPQHQDEAPISSDQEVTAVKSAEDARREKRRQRKILKRKQKRNKNKDTTGAVTAMNMVEDTRESSD